MYTHHVTTFLCNFAIHRHFPRNLLSLQVWRRSKSRTIMPRNNNSSSLANTTANSTITSVNSSINAPPSSPSLLDSTLSVAITTSAASQLSLTSSCNNNGSLNNISNITSNSGTPTSTSDILSHNNRSLSKSPPITTTIPPVGCGSSTAPSTPIGQCGSRDENSSTPIGQCGSRDERSSTPIGQSGSREENSSPIIREESQERSTPDLTEVANSSSSKSKPKKVNIVLDLESYNVVSDAPKSSVFVRTLRL